MKLDEFTTGYLNAMLWSSVNDEGDPMDQTHDLENTSPELLQSSVVDCAIFQANCERLWVEDELSDAQAGHNFWLTRAGHGAGFWDGRCPVNGAILTIESKKFKGFDPYIGDDGKVYGM